MCDISHFISSLWNTKSICKILNFKKHLPITLPVLYVGLKNNWLTAKEVVVMVNGNSEKLNCNEKILMDINVYGDDKATMLEILRKKAEAEEYTGIRAWQLAHLIAIEQSELSVHEKLKEVELQWSRFEYAESWRDFIYYMPNEKVNTEEGVYQNFLTFLNEEKKKLIE
jgi:hypothetical protein